MTISQKKLGWQHSKMPSPKKRPAAWRKVLSHPLVWIGLAVLPAAVIFANRVLIPDMSTDVISYHLFNGLRGLSHPLTPFLPTEFYPVGIANIPSGLDSITTVARMLLGYRLGTILSFASMVVIAIMLYKILSLILTEHNRNFNPFWGLLLINSVIVMELYFQLATYFIDNLNSALLLVLLYACLRLAYQKSTSKTWLIGLYLALGVMVSLKLTNIPFVIPMVIMLVWHSLVVSNKQPATNIAKRLALAVLVAIPIMPLWISNYNASRNPVFPFYNKIFQSQYYPSVSFTDTTFGGRNLPERLLWPITSLRDQLRLGEPHHIYNDYKLVICWLVGLVVLILYARRQLKLTQQEVLVVSYFMSSLFLWGLLFGINRYATSSIALGGIVIAIALLHTPYPLKKQGSRLGLILMAIVLGVLAVEDFRIIKFNTKYDMSWRPTLSANKSLHRAQLHHLFDKRLSVTEEQATIIDQADITLNCHTNVSGLITLLPKATNKPMVNIISDGLPQYQAMSTNSSYRHELRERLKTHSKTLEWVSVVSDKDIGPTSTECFKNIQSRNGKIIRQQPLKSFLGYSGPHLYIVSGIIEL